MANNAFSKQKTLAEWIKEMNDYYRFAPNRKSASDIARELSDAISSKETDWWHVLFLIVAANDIANRYMDDETSIVAMEKIKNSIHGLASDTAKIQSMLLFLAENFRKNPSSGNHIEALAISEIGKLVNSAITSFKFSDASDIERPSHQFDEYNE